MKCLKFLSVIALVSSFYGPSVNASTIAIDSMFVEKVAVALVVNNTRLFSYSNSFPSFEIVMGEYQGSIVSFGNRRSGLLNIYSTNLYGAAAPTGYVDGATINVDLSSIRAGFDSRWVDFDVGLWPINTPQNNGVYDPNTGRYVLDWRYNFIVDNPGFRRDFSGNFMVSLQGGLITSSVPVPAAFWLFGSGMLAFAAVARRNR